MITNRIKWVAVPAIVTVWIVCQRAPAQPLAYFSPDQCLWFQTSVDPGQNCTWINTLDSTKNPDLQAMEQANPVLINFNDALCLSQSGKTPPLLILPTSFTNEGTIMFVSKAIDSLPERIIWSMETAQEIKAVVTNHRFANPLEWQYRNFIDFRNDLPLITTFFYQNDASTIAPPLYLRIGNNPDKPKLPVSNFKGAIPEFFIFDKILSENTRQIIESYLAIKYAIPLSGMNYLNSKGDIIWDQTKLGNYSQHIAALGRDDAFALFQKQASSSYQPGLLSIGVGQVAERNSENQALLEDNTFLIWGDNGGPLQFLSEYAGQVKMLGNRWVIKAFGSVQELETCVRFNLNKLEEKADLQANYWLVIDRSGTGEFPAGAVEYFPSDKRNSQTVDLTFSSVQWDTDNSGTDIFTLVKGGPIIPKLWLFEPTCNPEKKGHAALGAEGGHPPYHFQVVYHGTTIQDFYSADNAIHSLEALDPGPYQFKIWDAGGAYYEAPFFLQSSDAPISTLENHYILKPGATLVLDGRPANAGAGLSYYWSGPNEWSANTPEITISKPGEYGLIIDRYGCQSGHHFSVAEYSDDPVEYLELFPNPTINGHFQLRIKLKRPETVQVQIYDAAGRMLDQDYLRGRDYYAYSGFIAGSGMYSIVLQAGASTRSLMLAVQ